MHAARALLREDDRPARRDSDSVQLIEPPSEHFVSLLLRPVAGHIAVRGRDDEFARARRDHPARIAGVAGGEQKTHAPTLFSGAKRVGERTVGHIEKSLFGHRQTEREVESFGNEVPGLAAFENLGDISGDIRYEQPIADERAVVEAGREIGQHRALAVARIDAQHLSAVHLGRDDEPL